LSLDGVAEAPDRFITAWDDETDASGADLIATQDAVILGRRSYDEWAEFSPGSEIEPFASFINAVPTYVATSTPLERGWTNSRVIDGGLVDFVRQLKGRRAATSASTAASRSLGRCLLPASSTSSGSSSRRRSP
jgi:dihydrofolate reductase